MDAQQVWVDALIDRFVLRAEAVKKSGMPPLEGLARRTWIKQKEFDYMDYALLGDAKGTLKDGVLYLEIDLSND